MFCIGSIIRTPQYVECSPVCLIFCGCLIFLRRFTNGNFKLTLNCGFAVGILTKFVKIITTFGKKVIHIFFAFDNEKRLCNK